MFLFIIHFSVLSAVIGEQRAALNALNKADTYVVTAHDLFKMAPYLRLSSKLAQR